MNDLRQILQVKNLTKVYPSLKNGLPPLIAVNNISIDLPQGQILGLLGPNGAGKTTTIQMILGTLTPTAGSITIFGLDFFFLPNRNQKKNWICKYVCRFFRASYCSRKYDDSWAIIWDEKKNIVRYHRKITQRI